MRMCFCSDRQQPGNSCRREGRSSCITPRKVECPGLGECAWRYENFCSILLAHGRMDSKSEAIVEAVKRARATKHQWLVACDANMSPVDFETSPWLRKDQMHVMAPEGASTCRSKSAKGDWVEKVYDCVIACNSLKGKISQMKVVEDFESRPHEAVSFLVESAKEMQEWSEQKLRKCCREKHKRKRQRRRGSRGGQRRDENQEWNRARSRVRH